MAPTDAIGDFGMQMWETSKVRSSPLVIVRALFIMAWGVGMAVASDSQELSDGFEASNLDQSKWYLRQLTAGKHWIDHKFSRNGKRSLAIEIAADTRGCENDCQRNEIRTPADQRVKFGQEAWYSFSFRFEGDYPIEGNTRWVSGQWKQENGRSPFLSQRFDRGVFHIAVHDNDCRILVARAEGDLELIGTTIDTSRVVKHTFQSNKSAYRCDTNMTIESGDNPILPNPYKNWVDMIYRVRGGIDGNGLIEVWANDRFIVRVRGSIGHREMTGTNQYFKFGIYRDHMPGRATVYFDDFRRSERRP